MLKQTETSSTKDKGTTMTDNERTVASLRETIRETLETLDKEPEKLEGYVLATITSEGGSLSAAPGGPQLSKLIARHMDNSDQFDMAVRVAVKAVEHAKMRNPLQDMLGKIMQHAQGLAEGNEQSFADMINAEDCNACDEAGNCPAEEHMRELRKEQGLDQEPVGKEKRDG